jgi:hypothetical protein
MNGNWGTPATGGQYPNPEVAQVEESRTVRAAAELEQIMSVFWADINSLEDVINRMLGNEPKAVGNVERNPAGAPASLDRLDRAIADASAAQQKLGELVRRAHQL